MVERYTFLYFRKEIANSFLYFRKLRQRYNFRGNEFTPTSLSGKGFREYVWEI